MRLASALCLLALLSSGACADNRSDKNAPTRHIVYWEKWTDFEGEAMEGWGHGAVVGLLTFLGRVSEAAMNG